MLTYDFTKAIYCIYSCIFSSFHDLNPIVILLIPRPDHSCDYLAKGTVFHTSLLLYGRRAPAWEGTTASNVGAHFGPSFWKVLQPFPRNSLKLKVGDLALHLFLVCRQTINGRWARERERDRWLWSLWAAFQSLANKSLRSHHYFKMSPNAF